MERPFFPRPGVPMDYWDLTDYRMPYFAFGGVESYLRGETIDDHHDTPNVQMAFRLREAPPYLWPSVIDRFCHVMGFDPNDAEGKLALEGYRKLSTLLNTIWAEAAAGTEERALVETSREEINLYEQMMKGHLIETGYPM